MNAVVEEKDQPSRITGETVDMGAWVAANQPRLHPTRRKVLTVMADLTRNGRWTTSSKVRAHTGLSQQLLNRHLRALQDKDLVELENPGPGLPLNARVTNAGLRALGLSGPKKDNAERPGPAADEPARREPQPDPGEAKRLAGQPRFDIGQKDEFLSALTEMIYKSVQAKLGGLATGQGENPTGQNAPAPQARPEPRAPAQRPAGNAPHGRASAPEDLPRQQGRMEEYYARPSQDAPPELNPAEAALENKLSASAQTQVRGLPWYQRTKQFQNVWDQLRRRHLGQLTTYFNSFGPRWQRLDWAEFNMGRRQADARSADYRDWIMAQFDRVTADGNRNVQPSDLHGREAIQAYLESRGIGQEDKKAAMGPPPYTPETFDLRNPDHVAYADKVLQDMAELGLSVYGDAKEGPIKLVAQAVSSGNFPKAALELRPDWKEKVLSSLRLGRKSSPETAVSANLGLII